MGRTFTTVPLLLALAAICTTCAAGPFQPPAKPYWDFATRGAVLGGPVVAGPNVFVAGAEGALYAVRLRDGTPAWTAAVGAAATSALTVQGEMVYVGTRAGHLICLRTPMIREGIVGVEMWRFGASGAITAPPVITASGLIIFASEDGICYALDRRGREVWRRRTGGPIRGALVLSPAAAPRRGSLRHTSRSSLVYCASTDGVLYALRDSDGEPVWTFTTGAPLEAGALQEAGKVIAANAKGKVVALDGKDGRLVWEQKLGGVVRSSPVCAENRVYFACASGIVTALALSNGESLWDAEVFRPVVGSPALTNSGHLVVASGAGMMYTLRRIDGRAVWAKNVGEAITTGPTIAERYLLFGTATGKLRAFVPGGQWQIDPPPVKLSAAEPAATPKPAETAPPVDHSSNMSGVAMSLLTASGDRSQPPVQLADGSRVLVTGPAPDGATRASLHGEPIALADGIYRVVLDFGDPGAYPLSIDFFQGAQLLGQDRRIVAVNPKSNAGSAAPIFVSPGDAAAGKVALRLGAEAVDETNYVSVLTIQDKSGASVRTWAEVRRESVTFEWDGLDQWGKPVAGGEYMAVYTLRGIDGRTRSVYQPLIVDAAR